MCLDYKVESFNPPQHFDEPKSGFKEFALQNREGNHRRRLAPLWMFEKNLEYPWGIWISDRSNTIVDGYDHRVQYLTGFHLFKFNISTHYQEGIPFVVLYNDITATGYYGRREAIVARQIFIPKDNPYNREQIEKYKIKLT